VTALAILAALLVLLLWLRTYRQLLAARYRDSLRSFAAQCVARHCRELRDDLDVAEVVGAELTAQLHDQAARYDAAIEALTRRIAELTFTPFDMVRAFHAKVGQPDAPAPNISQHRELRVRLIDEEFRELRDALDANDVVEVADALADLLYVVIGSALQWGIPLERVFAEVHRSNMTKERGSKRADGKILKGPNYSPPDVAGVLRAARDLTSSELLDIADAVERGEVTLP
jgi:predicted HAD superfamily Cof-like phosphohydrolase